MSSKSAVPTDLRLLVVDANICDCKIGARRVGRPAERAALDGPRRIPERTRDLDWQTEAHVVVSLFC